MICFFTHLCYLLIIKINYVMAKTFKITEAQHKQMLDEGVTIQGETDSAGKADPAKTAQAMNYSGVDPKKTKVEFNGSAMSGGENSATTPVTEHKLVTKKQLQANRLRYLKENSEILSLNNFMKKLH